MPKITLDTKLKRWIAVVALIIVFGLLIYAFKENSEVRNCEKYIEFVQKMKRNPDLPKWHSCLEKVYGIETPKPEMKSDDDLPVYKPLYKEKTD
ncbi:MAG: hypothetical protein AAB546_00165 [Patescibacteria group bacterium]